jgi:hypothetical protein
MLKGQAKKDFEKWLNEPIKEHGRFGQLVTNTFDTMPFSMQIGVLIDWFDSVGIDPDEIYEAEKFNVFNKYQDNNNHREEININTIEQANKIYNER